VKKEEEKTTEKAVKLSLLERFEKNCWTGKEVQRIARRKEKK